jgi:hypothetical protein
MSNLWISAKSSYVPGPQRQSMTEPNQVQASAISLPSFNYQSTLHTATAPTEPNQIQATVSITSFNYA